ncbi:SICAvar - type I [Plasmodium knowlesi]|nr:SICAvar - type I [Plasmodium knowlesi]
MMNCVLLNAIADKLENEKFPCKDERKVADAIKKAFERENENIKNQSEACKADNVKCFKCPRVPNIANCRIGEESEKKELKDKVEEMLKKDGGQDEMKKIEAQAIKDICK